MRCMHTHVQVCPLDEVLRDATHIIKALEHDLVVEHTVIEPAGHKHTLSSGLGRQVMCVTKLICMSRPRARPCSL